MGLQRLFVSGQVSMDADGTLVGAQALAEPGYLIEVEAIATGLG